MIRKTNAGIVSFDPNNGPAVFLRRPDVERATGLSRSSLYYLVERGEFPRPIRIGTRAVAWIESEILAWQRERIEARDGEAA